MANGGDELVPGKLVNYIDSACEIYSVDNDLIAVGKLKDVRTEPCLTVELSASSGGDMPKITPGTEIKISLVNTKLGFLGLFGRVYIVHDQFWRVDELRCLGEHERRGYFRVKSNSAARISPLEEEDKIDTLVDTVYQGTVTNVSLSGLLFAIDVDKCLFKVDSRLRVSGFSIGESPHRFTVICRVRRVMQHQVAGRLYGCEFEKMDEKESDKLCQALFAQQRVEIQRRRGIS